MKFVDKLTGFLSTIRNEWILEKWRVNLNIVFLLALCVFSAGATVARAYMGYSQTGPIAWSYFLPPLILTIVSLVFAVILFFHASRTVMNINSFLLFFFLLVILAIHGGPESLYGGLIPIYIILNALYMAPALLVVMSAIGMASFSFILLGKHYGIIPGPAITIERESTAFFLVMGNLMILITGIIVIFLSQVLKRERSQIVKGLMRYRSLIESAPDPILVYDSRGYFTFVNRAALDMLKFKDENDILGQKGEIILPRDEINGALEVLKETLSKKEPRMVNLEFMRSDGERVYVEMHLTPVVEENRVISFVGVCRDITDRTKTQMERNALQESFIMQDKMASLGRMVLGIAHEYNNILAGIRGYAQLAQIPGKENRMRELPDIAIELVDRAQDVTEGLLSFSDKFDLDTTMFKPIDMVNGIIKLLRKDFERKSIAVEIRIPAEVEINSDIAKLQQVILNLISNAADSMPGGGSITIGYSMKNDCHVIDVSDQGDGIPEEMIPVVFEPFFTTKGSLAAGKGEGVGMGLSICYSIVKGLGGEISVESERGVGTTFSVIVPDMPRQNDSTDMD